MRTLHVAALPFPTRQGTQALLRQYLSALARFGHEPHLLCYAHAAPDDDGLAFPIHRVRDGAVDRSERSGPSWAKVRTDVALARAVGRTVERLAPEVVIAHHVEAAAACLLADVRPLAFVLHTRLDAELPAYLPRAGALSRRTAVRVASALGALADRALVSLVGTIGTVSPDLARHVAQEVGGAREVIELVAPWPIAEPATDAERRAARARLGLALDVPALLFAGNLDAYQGWEGVIDALALLRGPASRAVLLVASASEPGPLLAYADRAGVVTRVRVVPLGGEPVRRAIHAAADVVVVPRRVPGGLPVKLLDALARGACVVAERRALAGLETVREAVLLCDDDDPGALARTLTLALLDAETRRALGAMGRELVRSMHSDRAFVATFGALCEAART